jgi:hypothetical protein
MKTTRILSLSAAFAVLILIFLISCGTVGEEGGGLLNGPPESNQGGNNPINPSSSSLNNNFAPSSSSLRPSSSSLWPSSSSLWPSSSSLWPSSSSIPTPIAATNAVVITLTYWETDYTDGTLTGNDPDPQIYFVVTATQGNLQHPKNSDIFLEQDNLKSPWTGSISKTIQFASPADKIVIEAVVIEKNALTSSTYISPGYINVFEPAPAVGKSGLGTLDYGPDRKKSSKVNYSYEFIRM